jgi:hypothetical protein
MMENKNGRRKYVIGVENTIVAAFLQQTPDRLKILAHLMIMHTMYTKIISDAEDKSEEEKLVHRNHQYFSV